MNGNGFNVINGVRRRSTESK